MSKTVAAWKVIALCSEGLLFFAGRDWCWAPKRYLSGSKASNSNLFGLECLIVRHAESPARDTNTLILRSDTATNRRGMSPPQGCLLINLLSSVSAVDGLVTLCTALPHIIRSLCRPLFRAKYIYAPLLPPPPFEHSALSSPVGCTIT